MTTTIALFVHKLNTQKYNKRRLFELEKQRMKKNIHQYDCVCSRVHSYMHACVRAPMCVLVAGELKQRVHRLWALGQFHRRQYASTAGPVAYAFCSSLPMFWWTSCWRADSAFP